MADDITVRVGLDASEITAGIDRMVSEAKSRISSLSQAVSGGQSVQSPQSQQVFSGIGSLFGGQQAQIRQGDVTQSERNRLLSDLRTARGDVLGTAQSSGLADIKNVQALYAGQKETFTVEKARLEGQKATTEELAKQAELARGQSVNYQKLGNLNQRIQDSFTPIQGPPIPGANIEQIAAAQIASGKERIAIEKEVNRQQLANNNDLDVFQKLQLKSNVTFGRRNLEGLPPSGGELLAQSIGTIGRYAVAGAAIYGVTSGISSSIKEAENLQLVLGHLQVQLQTIGAGDQFKTLSASIFQVAKDTGTSVSEVAGLTSQFVGVFAGSTGNVTAGVEAATKIATELGVVGNLKPGEIFHDLASGMKAFADSGSSADLVKAAALFSDIVTNVSRVTGVSTKELSNFIGTVAPIAKTSGLSPQDTAAIGAALLQDSGVGGAARAQQLGGILSQFSKTAGPAIALLVQQVPQLRAALSGDELTKFDNALKNSDPTVLFGLAKGFDTLSQAQQNNIIQTLASRRESSTLAAILQNNSALVQAQAAANTSAGATQDEFNKRQEQFAQKLKELRVALTEIGVAILNSGLLSFATDLAKVLEALASPLLQIIGLFDKIPDSIRTAAVALAAAKIAFSIFSGRGGGGAAAGGVPYEFGVTAEEAAIGGSALGGNLLGGGGFLPFLPAIGGQLAGGVVAGSGFGKTEAGGITSGLLRGAGIGATIGSIVPGFGTLAGAGIGGAIGGLIGAVPHDSDNLSKLPSDLAKLTQKQFDDLKKTYDQAQAGSNAKNGGPGRDLAREFISKIDAKYPDLKNAILKGVQSIADIPAAVSNKINDISTTLDEAIAEFKSGDLTLGELNQQFAINEAALSGLNGADAGKQLAKITKSQQVINDKAIEDSQNFIASVNALGGGKGGDPQTTLDNLRQTLSLQTGKDARLATTVEIVKAQKLVLDAAIQQAKDNGDLAGAIKTATEGIPVSEGDQTTIIQGELDAQGGAFQRFLAEYLVDGLTLPQEMTSQLAAILVAGGDAVGTVKKFFQDELDALTAAALGSFLAGGLGSTPADLARIKELQDSISNLDSKLGPSLGTVKVPNVTADSKTIDSLKKSGATAANTLRKAQADLLKAYNENDPVALAQAGIRDADIAAQEATTDAERVSAMAARVRADHALTKAIDTVNLSKIQLFQAIFQANGDLINAAEAGVAVAQLELQQAESSGAGEAAINAAKGKVVAAQRSADDTILQQGIDNEKFAYDMKQITAGSFIAYLQNLLALPTLTNKESQDIQLQIKQLKDTLGQQYALDLPTFLKVPTLYESRRLDQTNGSYQDNRQIVITLTATNGVDGQAAVNQIVDALTGPPRFGTTPRLY